MAHSGASKTLYSSSCCSSAATRTLPSLTHPLFLNNPSESTSPSAYSGVVVTIFSRRRLRLPFSNVFRRLRLIGLRLCRFLPYLATKSARFYSILILAFSGQCCWPVRMTRISAHAWRSNVLECSTIRSRWRRSAGWRSALLANEP